MPYYHIRIKTKSNPNRTEVALDFSIEKLMERYVVPYRNGQPLLINGRTISPKDLERLQVSETEENSAFLRDIVRKERSRNIAGGFLDIVGPSNNERIARKGKDVTDEFITGPPGSGPKTTHNAQKEVRPAAGTRDVFVVHGRNNDANTALFEFLRSIDLHPLEWSEVASLTGKPSPYIGEILDTAFSHAHAVVVLLTPDDEAWLKYPFRVDNDPPHETQLTGQARPNVLFEAGMAMGRDETRTVLVELGNLRPFSDMAGRHVIRMNNSSQRRQELAQRLEAAGCPVNLVGTDWHTAGDFESAIQIASEESDSHLVNGRTDKLNEEESTLSEDAKELLIEATSDRFGIIMVTRLMHGIIIQTNRKQFGETGDRRSEARWEQAVEELLEQGLIQDSDGSGNHFEVTHKGFQVADQLAVQN